MTAKAPLCDSIYCRLCGEENKNGTNLFSNNENSDSLSQLVNKYLPIKVIDNNKYPKTICPGCHIQLEATKLFFDLIIEGQAKLRQLYQVQQETKQRQEIQKQKLEAALKNVNPNSTVETYTIETDASGDKYLIQIFSDGPLFPPEHELSLRVEGLEKPRRKRGRPPKQINHLKEKVEEEPITNRTEEEESNEAEGRKRRIIKAPARFQGVVQGEELDTILKEEGVLDLEDIADEVPVTEHENGIIGRIETANGEDLGEPVFTHKSRLHNKYDVTNKKKNRKKFECEICKKEFLHPGRLALHRNSHNVQYKCETSNCDFEHENIQLIQKHQEENNHTGIITIENFTTVGTIQLPEAAQQIDVSLAQSNTEIHKCKQCEKTFACKQNLNVHVGSVHEGEKPFSCHECDQKFAYASSLKVHQLVHDKNGDSKNKKDYPCDQCGKVLRHPSSLLYHKETVHNNGRRFICNTCNRSFKHRQLLQRHQLVHSTARPYVCKHCQECFKTQANLVNHQAVHNGIKKFCCNICGQKFAHRTSLTLHQRWHDGHKPYKCDICEKSFSQKGNLAEHRRIHTGEKPFCCEQCGRSFTTSSQFSLHLKRHTGERPWCCQYCPRRFLHKDTFKAHIRRHMGDRPHKCRSCTRSFSERWALRRHERVHSGEKPYSCPDCDKTFADSSNRQKHMKTHYTFGKVAVKDASVKCSNIQPKVVVMEPEKTIEETSIELTQLVDETGSPISIKIDGGYSIPVVTSDGKKTVHGLMPDGTLIPIEVGELQEKEDIVGEIEINSSELLSLGEDINEINGINIMKSEDPSLGTNLQLLTDDDNPAMCLLTYAVDTPQLEIDSFLIDTIKKGS